MQPASDREGELTPEQREAVASFEQRPKKRERGLTGGALYLSGCEVELVRDALVLDVRIADVDRDAIESIVVTLDGVEIALLGVHVTDSP